jgi:hypothetical protein
MAVPVHGSLVAEPLHDRADEEGGGLGRCHAERVDDDDLARPRLDGGLVRLPGEAEVGARTVDPEVRDLHACRRRRRHRRADAAEHRVA